MPFLSIIVSDDQFHAKSWIWTFRHILTIHIKFQPLNHSRSGPIGKSALNPWFSCPSSEESRWLVVVEYFSSYEWLGSSLSWTNSVIWLPHIDKPLSYARSCSVLEINELPTLLKFEPFNLPTSHHQSLLKFGPPILLIWLRVYTKFGPRSTILHRWTTKSAPSFSAKSWNFRSRHSSPSINH